MPENIQGYVARGKMNRAQALLSKYPVTRFVYNEVFTKDEFRKKIEELPPGLQDSINNLDQRKSDNTTSQILIDLCAYPVLTREQEVHIFKRLNYWRWTANNLRDSIENGCQDKKTLDDFEKSSEEWIKLRNMLLMFNMRLIVNFLKKKYCSSIMERISDCSVIALRSIDNFDWSQGNKFSTYFMWALKRSCYRDFAEDSQDRLVRGEHGKSVEMMTDATKYAIINHRETPFDDMVREDKLKKDSAAVTNLFKKLTKRQVDILRSRCGFNGEKETLSAIGRRLHISKERVRQLEKRAIKLLRNHSKESMQQ